MYTLYYFTTGERVVNSERVATDSKSALQKLFGCSLSPPIGARSTHFVTLSLVLLKLIHPESSAETRSWISPKQYSEEDSKKRSQEEFAKTSRREMSKKSQKRFVNLNEETAPKSMLQNCN